MAIKYITLSLCLQQTLEVTLAPKDQTVQEGKSALFECSVSSVPLHAAWLFDGQPVTSDELYEISEDREKGLYTLFLPQCFPEDAGLYTFIAGLLETDEIESSARLHILGLCMIF